MAERFPCRVGADGKLPLATVAAIRERLQLLANADVVITIRRKVRSQRANRYYWGVVIKAVHQAMLAAGMACTAVEIHETFKYRYLGPVALDESTEPPTTTELDQAEFFRYCESIRYDEEVLALGVHIPKPEELVGSVIYEPRKR